MSGIREDREPPTGAVEPVTGRGEIPGPVFVKWFGGFFVLLVIAVLIGGFMVTGGVRRTASETDNALRTIAWELLRWSAGHDGRMPTSEVEFIDGLRNAADPPSAPTTVGEREPWPVEARTALQGRRPANIPDALARIKVTWPTKPTLAPELSTDGKPLLPGTRKAVDAWLQAWVEHHRTSP